MHIKICGIQTLESAMVAVEAGADLLGFNFYPSSPRYIAPQECRLLLENLCTAIGEKLRQTLSLVGVFVNTPFTEIQSILELCKLDLAQLSGNESPQLLQTLGERAFKALRPKTVLELSNFTQDYPPRANAPAWLVDAYRPGEYGGTGQTADWRLAQALAQRAPILLAGGLHPGNVADAIEQVHPWGVDVASGVESAPGIKDHQKITAFVYAARFVQESWENNAQQDHLYQSDVG